MFLIVAIPDDVADEPDPPLSPAHILLVQVREYNLQQVREECQLRTMPTEDNANWGKCQLRTMPTEDNANWGQCQLKTMSEERFRNEIIITPKMWGQYQLPVVRNKNMPANSEGFVPICRPKVQCWWSRSELILLICISRVRILVWDLSTGWSEGRQITLWIPVTVKVIKTLGPGWLSVTRA